MSRTFAFDDLRGADLIVDAVYEGGSAGNIGDDPLAPLLGVGNQGGFRAIGSPMPDGCRYAVLFTRGDEPDWPDHLHTETGQFIYFGDNRSPGRRLHDTSRRGNQLLRHVFDAVHRGDRNAVPPLFVFQRVQGPGRDVRFLGLAAPGFPGMGPDSDLVAIWRSQGSERFQNYRAAFTILDVGAVRRTWIESLHTDQPDPDLAPPAWQEWVRSGRYAALQAPQVREVRTKAEQLPHPESVASQIIAAVHEHFGDDPYAFERFAMFIWRSLAPNSTVDGTRPSRDGGRDALGVLWVGPESNPVGLSFSLEAKCYGPANSVGIRETSRLISRLKHREFGVLVTTSYVGLQAYKEIKEDGHPVTIVAGTDIARILAASGYDTPEAIRGLLRDAYPSGGSSSANSGRRAAVQEPSET